MKDSLHICVCDSNGPEVLQLVPVWFCFTFFLFVFFVFLLNDDNNKSK